MYLFELSSNTEWHADSTRNKMGMKKQKYRTREKDWDNRRIAQAEKLQNPKAKKKRFWGVKNTNVDVDYLLLLLLLLYREEKGQIVPEDCVWIAVRVRAPQKESKATWSWLRNIFVGWALQRPSERYVLDQKFKYVVGNVSSDIESGKYVCTDSWTEKVVSNRCLRMLTIYLSILLRKKPYSKV